MTTQDPFAYLSMADRIDIVRRMDVRKVARLAPAMDPEAIPVMLHKVRYEMSGHFTKAERQESRAWLEVRGYSRHRGLPWPPEGVIDM